MIFSCESNDTTLRSGLCRRPAVFPSCIRLPYLPPHLLDLSVVVSIGVPISTLLNPLALIKSATKSSNSAVKPADAGRVELLSLCGRQSVEGDGQVVSGVEGGLHEGEVGGVDSVVSEEGL